MIKSNVARVAAVALLMAGTASFFLHSRASANADPTGEQVLDKYIEVTGGKDAYSKAKSRVVTTKIAITPQNINGTLKTYWKAPNLLHTEGDFGMMTMESGYNGDIAYEKNSMTGTRILENDEKDLLMQQADVAATMEWKKYFKSAENKGVENINDKPAFKIELIPKKGEPVTQYYDKETGLLVQMNMKVVRPEGEFEITMIPIEWKEFDGLKLPAVMNQKIPAVGMEQKITIENLETNVEIPAEKFELPDDVKSMATSKPAGDDATTKPSGK